MRIQVLFGAHCDCQGLSELVMPTSCDPEGQSVLYELDGAEKTAVLLPEPERTQGRGAVSLMSVTCH